MKKLVLLSAIAFAIAYIVVLMVSAAWARADVHHQGCALAEPALQVDTAAHVLSLCRAGREEASFRVALGRGGIDKRAEGDGRTPRGRYSVGPARSSSRFHLFLPVGYPRSEQAKLGFTGGAVGVHGPHAAFSWLGHATVWLDWTLGCIAVGTRRDIDKIARWVAANHVSQIIIL